jgi:hypothetical protein
VTTNQPRPFCEYSNFAEKVLRDCGEHWASSCHQLFAIFMSAVIVE